MKNILISVATATFLSGLIVSSASAKVDPATLCFDQNTSNKKLGLDITIDRTAGVTLSENNLTLIPQGDYQGASFKLKFTNGGIPKDDDVIMCIKGDKVGSIQEKGEYQHGLLLEPTFSFIDKELPDGNVTFRLNVDDNCSKSKAFRIGAFGASCQLVGAVIINGKSTQGERIPSLDPSTPVTFGKTSSKIRIACAAPECFLQADKKNFSDNPKVAGINVQLTKQGSATPVKVRWIKDTCPDGECGADGNNDVIVSSCTTKIQIENNNDFNITGFDIKVDFDNGKPNLGKIILALDDNGTNEKNISTNYVLGKKVAVNGFKIAKDKNATINLTFITNGKDEIKTGNFIASINGMDSNEANNDISKEIKEPIATIKQAGLTKFTVPYMYKTSPSNFVKISTLIGDSEAELSAEIADNYGNTCSVTLKPIPGNGGSTYVWATPGKDNDERNYQSLIPAGECPDLKGKQYSIIFTTNASVNVVSYMRTKTGERTVNPF